MKTHHTKEKGDLGVAKVFADLVSKGYYVFFSNSEHLPFDLVAYKDGKFLRVSVKYRTIRKNKTLFVVFSNSWNDKNGTHTVKIDKDDIDIVSVYCPDTDRCYYLNPKEFDSSVTLRITKPSKTTRFHLIDDYLELKMLS